MKDRRFRGISRVVLWLGACLVLTACGTGSLTGSAETADRADGGGYIPGSRGSGDWEIQVVDDNSDAGHLGILRLDDRGLPVIAYFASSGTVYWIRYAAYDGWTWEIETTYETDTQTGCSLALDPSGAPVMAFVGGDRQPLYYWPFQSDLLLARREGLGWQTETVDEQGVVGLWASVDFDGFGLPGVSYQDLGNGIDYVDFHLRDLKYAYAVGDHWEVETVDPDGGGYYTRLVFDEDEQPAVAYCGNLEDDSQPVKMAMRGDYGWEIHTVDATGECAEGSLSARRMPGGGIGIAYYDGRHQDLRYAFYSHGVWFLETVESHNKVGKYCSLAYGLDGQPIISYYYCGRSTDSECQGGGDLRVARRTQTGWVVETVDSEGNTGLFTSIQVDSRGGIYVAYYDKSRGVLKMAVRH